MLLRGVSRMNCLTCEANGILQKNRHVPYALGHLKLDDSIVFFRIHINDGKRKSLPHFRVEEQAAVVHWITKHRVQGIVINSGTAFVSDKDQKGFCGPLLALGVSHKLDLGDAWSCATHVSCRSID